jgi:hypothetical protein
MILGQEQLLNTFALLMQRHNNTIHYLMEKSKINSLSATEQNQLSMAHAAIETYKISQNKMIQNWSK